MAAGTSQSNVPGWLTSDNIAKLAFTLPFLPLLVIIAWKAGILGGSSKKTSQAYDPKTGIGRGVRLDFRISNRMRCICSANKVIVFPLLFWNRLQAFKRMFEE